MRNNIIKSFIFLFSGAIAFVLLISFFPLLGSFWLKDFPLKQVFIDNCKLLVPLGIVTLIVSPFFGFITTLIRFNRKFWIILSGLIAYWVAVFFTMIFLSGISIFITDFTNIFYLSFWGFLAYSFFSIPLLIPILLLLERITRNNQKQNISYHKIGEYSSAEKNSVFYNKLSKWYSLLIHPFEKKIVLTGIEKLEPKNGEFILEIGSGISNALIELANKIKENTTSTTEESEKNITGIELSPELVKITRKKIKHLGLCSIAEIKLGNIEKLEFGDSTFDAVFSCFTYNSIPDKSISETLKECYRVLKPHGRMVILFLSREKETNGIIIYEWLHKILFKKFNYRPIMIREKTEDTGFIMVDTKNLLLLGLPVEIMRFIKTD